MRWCVEDRDARRPPHLPLCLDRSDALSPNGECRADDECCARETADGGGRAGVDRRELQAGARVRRLRGRFALEERLIDARSLTEVRDRSRVPWLRGRLALCTDDPRAAMRAVGTLAKVRNQTARVYGLMLEAGIAGRSRDELAVAKLRQAIALAESPYLDGLLRLGDGLQALTFIDNETDVVAPSPIAKDPGTTARP